MLGFRWLAMPLTMQCRADRLLTAEQFQRVLERERCRADRAGTTFTTVAIGLDGPDGMRRAWKALASYLVQRQRANDVVGWLADGRVGVLLAETEEDGAHRFCEHLREQLADHARLGSLGFELLVYPSAANPSEDVNDACNEYRRDAKPLVAVFLQPLPAWKRIMDVMGATLGLIVLSPLLAVTAIAVKLSSPGPIIFKQKRLGLGGKPFTLYKFRTMCVDAEQKKAALMAHNEQDGPAFKIKDDPRVTRVGRFLRRTCIDELPQFWNVLKGDMTLVGPRPLPDHESDQCQQWERRRLEVTPGMTCIWQAGGRRVSFPEWMRMDIRYMRRRTLWQDIKLLWKTFLKVILRRASY